MMQFQSLFKLSMQHSVQQLEKFPWEDRYHYAGWLSQCYYFVSHSTRLLALAAGFSSMGEENFHRRYLAHLKEEQGHDQLLLQDLKSLGVGLHKWPEFLSTQHFYQQQYFMVQKYGPRALLAWVIYLEGVASHYGPQALLRVQKVFQPSQYRFLKLHSEEDQEHINSAFELLQQEGGEGSDEFLYNFKNSERLYLSIYEDVKDYAQYFDAAV